MDKNQKVLNWWEVDYGFFSIMWLGFLWSLAIVTILAVCGHYIAPLFDSEDFAMLGFLAMMLTILGLAIVGITGFSVIGSVWLMNPRGVSNFCLVSFFASLIIFCIIFCYFAEKQNAPLQLLFAN